MTVQPLELQRWECVDLLRAHSVGRLCVIDAGFPLAFPVNYAIDGTDDHLRVIVRTSPHSIIGAYSGPGALEVDQTDIETGSAWSVLVRGSITHLLGTRATCEPLPMLASDRTGWTVLEPAAISGRRFTVTRRTDGYSVEWESAD